MAAGMATAVEILERTPAVTSAPRILVTGASGFIGQHLVRALVGMRLSGARGRPPAHRVRRSAHRGRRARRHVAFFRCRISRPRGRCRRSCRRHGACTRRHSRRRIYGDQCRRDAATCASGAGGPRQTLRLDVVDPCAGWSYALWRDNGSDASRAGRCLRAVEKCGRGRHGRDARRVRPRVGRCSGRSSSMGPRSRATWRR